MVQTILTRTNVNYALQETTAQDVDSTTQMGLKYAICVIQTLFGSKQTQNQDV